MGIAENIWHCQAYSSDYNKLEQPAWLAGKCNPNP
jgi:hypothetical protein